MDNSKSRMIRIRFVSILSIFILFSMFLITTIPVSACHYTVGTFESDYETSKESFFKGKMVYCRGNAYNYNYNLKYKGSNLKTFNNVKVLRLHVDKELIK